MRRSPRAPAASASTCRSITSASRAWPVYVRRLAMQAMPTTVPPKRATWAQSFCAAS